MIVRCIRNPNKENPNDRFTFQLDGLLLDIEGEPIDVPIVGQPICMATSPDQEGYDFMTSVVESFTPTEKGFELQTHAGPYRLEKLQQFA